MDLINLNGNWIYIIKQLGLAFIGIAILILFLRRKSAFKLKGIVILLIALSVFVTHLNSLNRGIYDEWFNIISGMNSLHFEKTPPQSTPFFYTRERYAWAPFTLFYEIVGIDKSYSNILMSGFGILMIIGASLAGAWLTGVVSKNQKAALIAGLLIGISPNTFASLPWPSSVQGDSLGIILVALTVGVWILARQTKDSKKIILALLFLAASLKGGGSVRTITTGALLLLTDVVLFSKSFRKKWLLSWLGVILIEFCYYFFNKGVHLVPRIEVVSIVVRVAQIMELTAKSLISPVILAKMIGYLVTVNSKVIWVVAIGSILFVSGSSLAIYCFVKNKGRLFTWAWAWFYLTASYAPWFAEGYGSTLSSINDRFNFNLLENAGYKYAYLPLVGLHVFLAIFLVNLLAKKKRVITVLILGIIIFRSLEFWYLDSGWAKEVGILNSRWQNMLFPLLPLKTLNPLDPKILILVDGKNNPIYPQSYSVEHGMFYNDSVIFYNTVKDFFDQNKNISKVKIENVYALAWDSGRQQVLNLTDVFRSWLKDNKQVVFRNDNFDKWAFTPSTQVSFGNTVNFTESKLVSPELNFLIPNPGRLKIKLDLYTESVNYKNDKSISLKLLCNTDHGIISTKKLVAGQILIEDQLGESMVKIPVYTTSKMVSLNLETKCSGAVLKKIIILGSPGFKFDLNNLELSFPYPN